MTGSSPRVRGKHAHRASRTDFHGLIPACAGKTRGPKSRTGRVPAHPRVCGENLTPSGRLVIDGGSSPRVRGKPLTLEGCVQAGRLIPACAGKTAAGSTRRPRRPAHPRVCGENALSDMGAYTGDGSSPRVRGKPAQRVAVDLVGGLIPACAGKTRLPRLAHRCQAAHPRVCGENLRLHRDVSCGQGSSPRVRGKPSLIVLARGVARLIPACAGKTGTRASRASSVRAHPRVCGENFGSIRKINGGKGSSPRVRGKLAAHAVRRLHRRLIPARAGKTLLRLRD